MHFPQKSMDFEKKLKTIFLRLDFDESGTVTQDELVTCLVNLLVEQSSNGDEENPAGRRTAREYLCEWISEWCERTGHEDSPIEFKEFCQLFEDLCERAQKASQAHQIPPTLRLQVPSEVIPYEYDWNMLSMFLLLHGSLLVYMLSDKIAACIIPIFTFIIYMLLRFVPVLFPSLQQKLPGWIPWVKIQTVNLHTYRLQVIGYMFVVLLVITWHARLGTLKNVLNFTTLEVNLPWLCNAVGMLGNVLFGLWKQSDKAKHARLSDRRRLALLKIKCPAEKLQNACDFLRTIEDAVRSDWYNNWSYQWVGDEAMREHDQANDKQDELDDLVRKDSLMTPVVEGDLDLSYISRVSAQSVVLDFSPNSADQKTTFASVAQPSSDSARIDVSDETTCLSKACSVLTNAFVRRVMLVSVLPLLLCMAMPLSCILSSWTNSDQCALVGQPIAFRAVVLLLGLPGIFLGWYAVKRQAITHLYQLFRRSSKMVKHLHDALKPETSTLNGIPFMPMDSCKNLIAWLRVRQYIRRYYLGYLMGEASSGFAGLLAILLILTPALLVGVYVIKSLRANLVMGYVVLVTCALVFFLLNDTVSINELIINAPKLFRSMQFGVDSRRRQLRSKLLKLGGGVVGGPAAKRDGAVVLDMNASSSSSSSSPTPPLPAAPAGAAAPTLHRRAPSAASAAAAATALLQMQEAEEELTDALGMLEKLHEYLTEIIDDDTVRVLGIKTTPTMKNLLISYLISGASAIIANIAVTK